MTTPKTAALPTWTAEQFWEFVEGLTDEFDRDVMRKMLADRGLTIAPARCDVQSARETALANAAQEFIDKVDRGEARSTKSYAAFKAALALPSAEPLCSCRASARDGQHMAWCPVVTSTNLGGDK